METQGEKLDRDTRLWKKNTRRALPMLGRNLDKVPLL